MRLARKRHRHFALVVGIACAAFTAGAALPHQEAVDGYGPWRFGMRHFQVAHVEEFGPYLPVQSSGGLETHNGELAGERARISFDFDDHGLSGLRIWAYEGDDVGEMTAALYRAFEHLSSRYGALLADGETLAPGLAAEEILARLPEDYSQPLAADGAGSRPARRSPARRIEIAPVEQPDGARVTLQLTRAPALRTMHVMVTYARNIEPPAATIPANALEGVAGAIEVVETTSYMPAPTFGLDEYDRRGGDDALLAQYPDLGADPTVRFFRLALGASQATMAIVGNYDSGFELRAVPPAVAEPTELRFARDDGRYVLTTELTASAPDGPYPVPLRLAVRMLDTGERVRTYALGRRRGTISMGDRELGFEVTGDFGIFNGWYDVAYFDLDGSGSFSRPRNSSERVHGYEGYVTIDGANWRFDVDRFGDRIWLTRLEDGAYPLRTTLDEGAMAPDFRFVDLEGVERRLSDFRGKLVLLDFWGAWCGPCRGEAPHMVEAYERYREDGFEIIGIDYRDSVDAQAAFMEEYGIEWLQTRESDSARPIHDLYRNWTWPTHYLIDENGRILAFNPRGERILELLEEHFGH